MIRKDFILRMIEEIAKTLAVLLGLIKKGDVEAAKKLYTDALSRVFKNYDEDFLLDQDVDRLKLLFDNEFGESYEGLEVVARLIVKGGDIHLASNNEEKAVRSYLKALELYNLVEMESGIFSFERQMEMQQLTQMIDQIKNS